MKSHFEFCDHAEIATASTQCPKQVRVLTRVATHDTAIGGDEREGFDVVAGEPESSSKPSRSAAQNQPGSSGVRDDTGRKNEPRSLRRVVNRSEKTAAVKLREARFGIHGDLAHPR